MARGFAICAVALAFALAWPAHASDIEDALADAGLPVTYQEDGGKHGDAPGTCEAVDPDRVVSLDGDASHAMVVQNDDISDAFLFPLAPDVVGDRISISILPGQGLDVYELAFDVVDAACGFSVFDPEAPIYQEPQGIPAEPVTPDEGEAAFEFTPSAAYSCDPDEWRILVKKTQGIWPADIYVEYVDGDYEYVPVEQGAPSEVAKFSTSQNLDAAIKRIVVSMPTEWKGSAMIAHGPCNVATEWTPPPAPVQEPLSGEFTVVVSGDYVVVVRIVKDAIQKASELLPPPPAVAAMDCHYGTCSIVTGPISFDVLPENQDA